MPRKIIYIKNPSSGSNFRTIGGAGGGSGGAGGGSGGAGGGSGANTPSNPIDAFGNPLYLPNPTGLVINGTVNLLTQTQSNLEQLGFASFSDWEQAFSNFFQGISWQSFGDFLFEGTLFNSQVLAELDVDLDDNAFLFPNPAYYLNSGTSPESIVPNPFYNPYQQDE